jgi:transposase
MLQTASEPEDALRSDHKSARKQRIEIITRGERRRQWTAEQKREIAAESLEPGASPMMVARKHGISSGQLYTWRQQLLRETVGATAETKPTFVRVDVVSGPPRLERAGLEAGVPVATTLDRPTPPSMPATPPPAAQPDGRIEIMLARGVSVRVDAKVDGAALRRVLAALERP